MSTQIQKNVLLDAYQRGVLIRQGKTESGSVKSLSYQRIAKYLALPLVELVKPFNFRATNEATYEVRVSEFNSDIIGLNFTSKDRLGVDCDLELKLNGHKWELASDSDIPLTSADIKKLPGRIWSVSANLPIGYMFSMGLISDKNLATILFTYLMNKASKKEIQLTGEMVNQLGQILYNEIRSNAYSSNFTVKEFFDNFLEIDWNLVSEHSKATRQGMTKLYSLPQGVSRPQ